MEGGVDCFRCKKCGWVTVVSGLEGDDGGKFAFQSSTLLGGRYFTDSVTTTLGVEYIMLLMGYVPNKEL